MPDQPQRAGSLSYRPDIDGLRAIAVLLVVFNHLKTRFSGGYIGVDVFFVISGYLISSAILSEKASGRFSIVSFYERRIRRIFPAMLVMMLAVCVLAYRFLVPAEVAATATSMLGAVFSVSNIVFWRQAGYFDAPSELKPLLHTWSLAVEEQFYIIFPLFLVVVLRWVPRNLKAAIWTVSGVSFGLACFWVQRDASTAFFLAPLRAWELLIGTILSQHYVPAIRGAVARNAASVIGLALILVPSLRYDATTSFPGFAALAPCLGAGLIIAAGETGGSVVGFVLSLRPVVFVGLISYSLYLWHWPILVFQKASSLLVAVHSEEGDKRGKVAVLAASLVVATLSWYFVERPFRKGRFRPGRTAVFAINGVVVALIAGLCLGAIQAGGLPFRFPEEARKVARYAGSDTAAASREGVCMIVGKAIFADFNPGVCLREEPGRRSYLLLGDSHAAALYPGLSTVFPEINVMQANTAGCAPLLPEPGVKTLCDAMPNYLYLDFLVHHHVDYVVLCARWLERQLPELARTIAWLQQRGMRVIVFGPAIEFDAPLPRMLATALRDGTVKGIETHRLTEPEQLDRKMASVVRKQMRAKYISIYEDVCASQVEMVARAQPETAGSCPLYAGPGVPLLGDADHLTPEGSILFAKAVRNRGQIP